MNELHLPRAPSRPRRKSDDSARALPGPPRNLKVVWLVGGETGKKRQVHTAERSDFSSTISAGLSGRCTRSQSYQEGVLFAFAPLPTYPFVGEDGVHLAGCAV